MFTIFYVEVECRVRLILEVALDDEKRLMELLTNISDKIRTGAENLTSFARFSIIHRVRYPFLNAMEDEGFCCGNDGLQREIAGYCI